MIIIMAFFLQDQAVTSSSTIRRRERPIRVHVLRNLETKIFSLLLQNGPQAASRYKFLFCLVCQSCNAALHDLKESNATLCRHPGEEA